MSATAEIAHQESNVELRRCRHCRHHLPHSEFSKRRGTGEWLHTCDRCRADRARLARESHTTSSSERQRCADRRVQYGHWYVDGAPDPAPARLLGELLAYDRDYGIGFDEAWAENVEFVVSRIKGKRAPAERSSWRYALESTRSAWWAAWHRTRPPRVALTRNLLDEVDKPRQAHERVV